jgi:hypothetical protein
MQGVTKKLPAYFQTNRKEITNIKNKNNMKNLNNKQNEKLNRKANRIKRKIFS